MVADTSTQLVLQKKLQLLKIGLYYQMQEDPIDKAIEKYKNHPIIKHNKQNDITTEKCNFRVVSTDDKVHQFRMLNSSKESPVGSIPVKIIKSTSNIIASMLRRVLNENIRQQRFPEKLKEGNITSLDKKDYVSSKKKYRPIAGLPSMSKIYERILESLMKPIVRGFLSPFLCGIHKKYSTQHALLRFVECITKSLDSGEIVGAVLMNLSKAFDCLNHDLLLAK